MADSSLNNTDDGNPGYGYATHYLQLGFSVIPIRSMDYDSLSGKYCKAPALPSGGLKPFFDTRADTNQLYDWFVTQGHSNMAICTGRVSGIVVIDFDSQAAYDTIKDTLPHTVIAKSPRGIHCYFSYPLGHTIKCMVGYRKNIDIKADGGYIICPPSTTADGKYRYEWIYSPFDTPLAPLPDMFITQKAVHHISGNVSIDSGKKTLEQLLDDIRNAPSGTANDTLNRTAYCIGVKVAQGHLSHADAEHQILEAGKARGIPYAEIISTGINSGLASGIIKGEANTIDHMHNAHINNITNANAPVQYVPQQQDDDIVQYLNRGEVGDAELLAKECAGSYLFDHSANKWLRRDGYVWREDSTRTIENCIPTTLAAKYCYRAAEASATNNMALAKLFEDRTKKLRDRQRIINVLKLAETQIDFACTGNEFDQLSGCLPCLNGIYQFDDGTFREGQPKDYVRTFIPHNWTGIDTCAPLFIKFIEQVFPDVALRDFVQRLFGYSILGTGAERILPIFWGIGANGKSTLIEIIRYVLGDFAATTPAETLLATQSHSDGAPQPFLFRLRGKRFVATSETEETRRLNASLVKSLTGMDTLCVRTLHGKPIEFTPRFLTLLSTNHRPRVNADDQAVWDRLLLVPFNARFVDNPQGANEYPRIAHIIDQFKAETSGILTWLVKGAHMYMQDGLCAPEMVRIATSEYRTNEDTLQQFLDECTTNGDNSRRIRASELYEAYKGWAERNGYGVLSIRTLGDRMIQKQIPRGRDANGVVYPGLIIRSMPAPAPKGGNYYQSSVGCRM